MIPMLELEILAITQVLPLINKVLLLSKKRKNK